MDQKQQEEQPVGGNVTPAQSHGKNVQNQANQMVAPSHPPTQTTGASSASSSYPRVQQYTHHYIHHLQQQELRQQLDKFWANQYQEIEDTTDFRNHSLPLARIKKIMKADEDVKMISAEAPAVFAKACEMFVLELTMRAWVNAEENKRRTLQKSDIASAISRTDVFDFLVDIVPRDDTMEHEVFVGMPRRDSAPIGNVPYYYYMPPQHAAGPSYGPPPRVLMGRPVLPQADYHRQQPHPFATPTLPIPKQQNHSSDSDD